MYTSLLSRKFTYSYPWISTHLAVLFYFKTNNWSFGEKKLSQIATTVLWRFTDEHEQLLQQNAL